jgi:adenylate cyclase, class 2
MTHEIEIKLRVKDLKALRLALRRLGGRLVSAGRGRAHEWNMVFDTPEEKLRSRGELLRIRTETPAKSNSKPIRPKVEPALLTFKRPVGGRTMPQGRPPRHKVREEIEVWIGDATTLTKIFEGLGLNGWFRYEKFRTTFRLPTTQRWAKGLLLELDETPIGTFLELEGPPMAIDRAAKALGFAKRDYIVTNYLNLYRKECQRRGKRPGDMVFEERKR